MSKTKSQAVLALEALESGYRDKFGVPKETKLNQYSLGWFKLFEELKLEKQLERDGYFRVTPTEIKNVTSLEPRLMSKHDFGEQRPWIFKDRGLSMLPLARGEYIVGQFDLYQSFPSIESSHINRLTMPSDIESFDFSDLTSEAVALNAAFIAGAFDNFLEDGTLRHTLSGRMSTAQFNIRLNLPQGVPEFSVEKAQMEIDAGYEGNSSLAIVEAKNKLSSDFNVRQLYFPFLRFRDVLRSKTVRNIYQVYSGGIVNLFEYEFSNPLDFTSIELTKSARYMLSNEQITLADLVELANRARSRVTGVNLDVPFPQADSFERVVNTCETLAEEGSLTKQELELNNGFTYRQADYYMNAGRYLGLIDLPDDDGAYSLSEQGKYIMKQDNIRDRNLAFAEAILLDSVFNQTFLDYAKIGRMPDKSRIEQNIKAAGLNISGTTVGRRASTVAAWVRWITDLVVE